MPPAGQMEQMEPRLLMAATLQDAGISQRVVDYIDNLAWTDTILTDTTLTNTLDALVGTQSAPGNATVLTTVGQLSQITAGTVSNPNVYLIQGDLSITNTIAVPSNVHIYVDGSIYKQGNFSTTGSVFNTENTGANADAIFRLNGSDNVKLIGVNDALLHSNPTLDASQPHTTAVFIHSNSSNVEVDGFEMAYVWNGVAAHPFNISDITVTNNYIHDTLNRAVWSLGTTNFKAAHNFVENAGMDSFDWDAFTDDAIGYENVSIGAGRWAGFVEEGTEDSYFIRGLGILADFGNPNRGFMLGWADNGSSAFFVGNNPNPADWTEHNYFIDNVIFDPNNIPQSGGDYFAKNNNGKGPTYFWANRGFGAGQSTNNFDNAEWLDTLPTAGGRNNAVNAVQLLADLDAEFNVNPAFALGGASLSVLGNTGVGTEVGTVTALNADLADVSFTITAGNTGNAFTIDNNGVITVNGPLDFVGTPSYTLTVEGADAASATTATATIDISVESPFTTVVNVFDHDFVSPNFFNAADARGQQGWTGQNGWAIQDAAGQGVLTSSTTSFQGVTNGTLLDPEAGQAIRVTMDLDLNIASAANGDLFRFGVTTLNNNGTGTFVPALGNNSGSFVSGKLRYDTAGSDAVVFYADESQGASVISVSAADLGLNIAGGDGQTDDLRLVWEATKSGTAGEWEIGLSVENLTTAQALGSAAVTVTSATAYGTSTGLFAGLRGLQNAAGATFNVDRYAVDQVTPGSESLAGDYNGDGLVSQGDLDLVLLNWGGNTLPAGFDPNALAGGGPFDGTVSQNELDGVLLNWGNTAPSQTAAIVSPVQAIELAPLSSTTEETQALVTAPTTADAVSSSDFVAAGISQRVIDTINNSEFSTQILGDSILENTLTAIAGTRTAPGNATVLTSAAQLSQITAGTVGNPNVYLIQGDLTITSNINVPSNVHIYVNGSIYKAGTHTRVYNGGSATPSENQSDYIFFVNNAQNVEIVGVNNALLHSRNNLDDQQGHATAVYVTGNQTNNVLVEGFEIGFVWEGLVARGNNNKNVVFKNNYVHDTLKRAIWNIVSDDAVNVHNFVENAGADGLDFDAYVDRSLAYENVVVGAGRWLGFVEEAAMDSAFVRNLGIMVDYGNPNADLYYQLGWVDHGTTPGVFNQGGQFTDNNYFIDNVVFRPTSGFNEGGDYYANNKPSDGSGGYLGRAYFWGNRGYGAGQTTNASNFQNAEWLDAIPTAGGLNNAVNGVQWLADLDALYNPVPTSVLLSAEDLSVLGNTSVGTAVGTVFPLNADVNDLAFSITAGNTDNAFAIDDDGIITVAGPLDFVNTPSYQLTVEATDSSTLLTGTTPVDISVESPFGTTMTVFDSGFASPDFSDTGDVRGQQGWTGQAGWGITDAAGQGLLTSNSTSYQGVTQNTRIDVGPEETVRVEIDVEFDLSSAADSDQFRYGFTTLDASDSFVPALGNNGGSIVSGKVRFEDDATDTLDFFVAEGDAGGVLSIDAADAGLNVDGGDTASDALRITWEATKSSTPGQWDVRQTLRNLTTNQTLGSTESTVIQAAAYNTTTGLYAGLRGLENLTQTTFAVDRYHVELVSPGASLFGDYNGDGLVSQGDLDLVLLNWGEAVLPTGFDAAALPDGSPFDGLISQNELDGVLLNWGNG